MDVDTILAPPNTVSNNVLIEGGMFEIRTKRITQSNFDNGLIILSHIF